MRPGKTDFRGKFWVGQHVRINFEAAGHRKDDFACDTGIIRNIHGQYLKTPELIRIRYNVRIDGDKLFKKPIFTQSGEIDMQGEYLEPL